MSQLMPTLPLLFLRKRLRATQVEEAFMDDQTLLDYITRGYQEMCQRSLCVTRLASITLSGAASYAFPADHYKTLLVTSPQWGVLDPIPLDAALEYGQIGYYRDGDTLGFQPNPDSGVIHLAYAATPPGFVSWTDMPIADFPAEYYRYIAHYVRWHVYRLNGGAGKLSSAAWERSRYEGGIAKLRRASRIIDAIGPAQGVLAGYEQRFYYPPGSDVRIHAR